MPLVEKDLEGVVCQLYGREGQMITMTRHQWALLLKWVECAYYDEGSEDDLEKVIDLLRLLGSEEE